MMIWLFHVLPTAIGLRIENLVVSPVSEERRGTKLDFYAVVPVEGDQLAGKVSPVGGEGRNLGKVMLTTLLKEVSTDPDNYHISPVQQYLSRDKTVRQYHYEFFDLSGRASLDGLARRLRETGVLDELNRALGFPLLGVTDMKWGFDRKYNYFKSSFHEHKEYEEWTGAGRKIFVVVSKNNDRMLDDVSAINDYRDDWKDRKFEKALLTTLFQGKTSADPDDYIINHVERRFSRDRNLREYGIHFFDSTLKLTQETVVSCLEKPEKLATLNRALGVEIMHVGDKTWNGDLEHLKRQIDQGFWKYR